MAEIIPYMDEIEQKEVNDCQFTKRLQIRGICRMGWTLKIHKKALKFYKELREEERRRVYEKLNIFLSLFFIYNF